MSASGILKADSSQLQLLSLGSSSSEQASTSKQQFPVDQPSYGASGSRESIFSLTGPGYMAARQNCSSRALGCVSDFYNFLLLPRRIDSWLILSQGGHGGQWVWKLRKLPSVLVGRSFCAGTNNRRWVYSVHTTMLSGSIDRGLLICSFSTGAFIEGNNWWTNSRFFGIRPVAICPGGSNKQWQRHWWWGSAQQQLSLW